MDELQTTVPTAYPTKLRCPQCNQSGQFSVLFVAEGHLRASCGCGWFHDLVNAGAGTLMGMMRKGAAA